MSVLFHLNSNETILHRSRPPRKWYSLLWRIGVGILEVLIFMLLSFTTFTDLTKSLLATVLLASKADVLSRVIFQGLVPLLVIAWFAEDTARIFTSELILTDQRVWTKGSPYAWTSDRDIPLTDIQSMSFRRQTLFIRLKTSRKVQAHAFPDGKQVVTAFMQITGRTDSA